MFSPPLMATSTMAPKTLIGSWPPSSCLHNLQRFWSHMTPLHNPAQLLPQQIHVGKKQTCVIFTWLGPKNELICFFPNSSLNESLETTKFIHFPTKIKFFFYFGLTGFDPKICLDVKPPMDLEGSLHLGWYFIDLTWSIWYFSLSESFISSQIQTISTQAIYHAFFSLSCR